VFENRAHLCIDHALDDMDLFKLVGWQQVREDVAERLGYNLRFLVHMAREGGASVLLAKVASNPRLPPCFGARQPLMVDLDPTVSRMDQWQRLAEGERALNEADFSLALELFSEAVGSDPNAPLAHSGRARALGGLGRHEEALSSYWSAREFAIGDFSSPALINETIARVAADLDLPLLDTPALFTERDRKSGSSPYHVQFIYDEVHPNAAGSDLIAASIAESAKSAGLLP
jgi:tetratricopeptide (TPR) repeat protein